jgi:hypothetical protein
MLPLQTLAKQWKQQMGFEVLKESVSSDFDRAKLDRENGRLDKNRPKIARAVVLHR